MEYYAGIRSYNYKKSTKPHKNGYGAKLHACCDCNRVKTPCVRTRLERGHADRTVLAPGFALWGELHPLSLETFLPGEPRDTCPCLYPSQAPNCPSPWSYTMKFQLRYFCLYQTEPDSTATPRTLLPTVAGTGAGGRGGGPLWSRLHRGGPRVTGTPGWAAAGQQVSRCLVFSGRGGTRGNIRVSHVWFRGTLNPEMASSGNRPVEAEGEENTKLPFARSPKMKTF